MGLPAPAYSSAPPVSPAGDKANAVLAGSFGAVGPSQPFSFLGPMNVAIWGSINTSLATTAGSLSATLGSATGLQAGAGVNSANVPPGTTIGSLSGTTATLAIPPISMPGQVSTQSASITGLPSTTGLVGATVTGPGIPSGTTVLSIGTAADPTQVPPVLGSVQISKTPNANSPLPELQKSFYTFARTGNAIVASSTDSAAFFTGAGVTFSATVQVERSFDGAATWVVCNEGGGGTLAQYSAGTPVSLSFGEPEGDVLYRLNCIAYTSGVINYRISETGQAATSLSIPTI